MDSITQLLAVLLNVSPLTGVLGVAVWQLWKLLKEERAENKKHLEDSLAVMTRVNIHLEAEDQINKKLDALSTSIMLINEKLNK